METTQTMDNMDVSEVRPVEEQEKITIPGTEGTDFVNEDNYEAFKLLNMKSKVNDVQRLSDDLKTKVNEVISDDDIAGDHIDKCIENLTESDINELTDEQLNDMFTIDGTPIEFAFDLKTEEDRLKFMRDYLIYRRQTIDSCASLDAEIEKMQKEMAENQEELNKLSDLYGNVSGLIKETLKTKIEEAPDEDAKNLYTKLLDNFNYALTLENVKAYLKTYKGKSVMGDYLNDKKSMYIYRSYKRVCKELQIETDITNFRGLEYKFFGPDFTRYNNIFIFAVLHYVSSQKKYIADKSFGLFLTQLVINLKNLFLDKFDSEEDKEVFTSAIRDIVRIID